MSAFTKSWQLLKEGSAGMDGLDDDGNYPEDPRRQNYRTPTMPIDMQQGSDGTWRAPNDTPPNDVSPEEKLWQQIQARNAQSRQNLQKPTQPTPTPTPGPGYSGWM